MWDPVEKSVGTAEQSNLNYNHFLCVSENGQLNILCTVGQKKCLLVTDFASCPTYEDDNVHHRYTSTLKKKKKECKKCIHIIPFMKYLFMYIM